MHRIHSVVYIFRGVLVALVGVDKLRRVDPGFITVMGQGYMYIHIYYL